MNTMLWWTTLRFPGMTSAAVTHLSSLKPIDSDEADTLGIEFFFEVSQSRCIKLCQWTFDSKETNYRELRIVGQFAFG